MSQRRELDARSRFTDSIFILLDNYFWEMPWATGQWFKPSLRLGNFCRLRYTKHQIDFWGLAASHCWEAYFVWNGERSSSPVTVLHSSVSLSGGGGTAEGQYLYSHDPWAFVLKARMLAANTPLSMRTRTKPSRKWWDTVARAAWCNVCSASRWTSFLAIVLNSLVHFCWGQIPITLHCGLSELLMQQTSASEILFFCLSW